MWTVTYLKHNEQTKEHSCASFLLAPKWQSHKVNRLLFNKPVATGNANRVCTHRRPGHTPRDPDLARGGVAQPGQPIATTRPVGPRLRRAHRPASGAPAGGKGLALGRLGGVRPSRARWAGRRLRGRERCPAGIGHLGRKCERRRGISGPKEVVVSFLAVLFEAGTRRRPTGRAWWLPGVAGLKSLLRLPFPWRTVGPRSSGPPASLSRDAPVHPSLVGAFGVCGSGALWVTLWGIPRD